MMSDLYVSGRIIPRLSSCLPPKICKCWKIWDIYWQIGKIVFLSIQIQSKDSGFSEPHFKVKKCGESLRELCLFYSFKLTGMISKKKCLTLSDNSSFTERLFVDWNSFFKLKILLQVKSRRFFNKIWDIWSMNSYSTSKFLTKMK